MKYLVTGAWRFWFYLILLIGTASCSGIGAQGLPKDRNSYNIAIQDSNNQQMLLNLVWLKYRDNPFFLEVNNVVDRYSYTLGADGIATLPNTGLNVFGIGGNASVSANPTVSYSPLVGENLGKRFLSRINIETLFILFESGWKIDRVLRVCVERIHNLVNAESASGPTPDQAPEFEDFLRFSKILRKLQTKKAFEIALVKKGGQDVVLLDFDPQKAGADLKVINRLLGLSTDTSYFFMTTKLIKTPNAFIIRTRPLRGMFYYLAHATSVPKGDFETGLVTATKDSSGTPFNWDRVTGDLLKIRSALFEPNHAAVSIKYRHHWFYISDADLNSKATFHLLTQMFQLLAGGIKSPGPLFTIDVGS